MRRLLWPGLIVLAFGIGLATGWGKGAQILQEPASPTLQARIAILQQELATKEAELVNLRQSSSLRSNRPLLAVTAPPGYNAGQAAAQRIGKLKRILSPFPLKHNPRRRS